MKRPSRRGRWHGPGRHSTPRSPPLTRLKASLDGPLVEPGDPGYDEARAVFRAMLDRRPRAIACAQSVADVARVPRFAASCRRKVARRARIKRRCDAGNVLRVNQNIVPA